MRKLSETEWISRFEQVQGRKPKPNELQLAYQSGLIGGSKNYNYIYNYRNTFKKYNLFKGIFCY